MTPQKALDDFLFANAALKPRTLDTYKYGINRYIGYTSSWPPTVRDLAGFLLFLQEEKVAPATVGGYLRSVRTWLNWLHRNGFITENPAKMVKPPRRSRRKVPRAVAESVLTRYVEELEYDVEYALRRGKLKTAWRNIRDLALISLLAGTGSRITETVLLTVYDVNLDTCAVRFRAETTKNGNERSLPFSNRVKGNLSLWLKTRAVLDIQLTSLFVGYRHGEYTRFTSSGARQAHKDRCKKMNIPHFTPHQLRHFYAVKSLDNGLSINRLQAVLDHASLETTQIYTTVISDPEIVRAAAPY